MNTATVEAYSWPRARWLTVALFILAGQIVCIFWLGARKPIVPVASPPVPLVYHAANPLAEWVGVESAAMFVLPNERGFSGQAWLKVSSLSFALQPWSDPAPPYLAAPVEQLAQTLATITRPNEAKAVELSSRPDPQFDVILPDDYQAMGKSTLTMEGELAKRSLVTPLVLESQPFSEILTNTIVRAGINAQGMVFSAIVLVSSGSKDADAVAYNLAMAARFKPAREVSPGQTMSDNRLQWGRMIFHWHTIAPPPTTNAPPASP